MVDPDFFGIKLFFLHPHSIIKEDILKVIIKHEYEVYFLYDHKKTFELLKKYPNSILFINIDMALKEEEWESYIKSLMSHSETKNVKIGIMTFNESKVLAEKYLMQVGITGGYVVLKAGFEECSRQILKILEANEARGRRKYVRAACGKPDIGSFNVKKDNKFYNGTIINISSVGAAITFDQAIEFSKNEVVRDIQLRLRGSLCMVSGVVAGVRDTGGKEYVVLFLKGMKDEDRDKISSFIHSCLQEEMDNILKQLEQPRA